MFLRVSSSRRYAPVAALVAGAVATLAAFLLPGPGTPAAWTDTALHSALEAAGGVVALGLVVILALRQRVTGHADARYAWIGASMLLGGVLDLAHACTHVGAAFFWSRTLATLLGGALAAGTLFASTRTGARVMPRAAGATAVLLAIALLAWPDRWPVAFDAAGAYTPWARALNVAGGAGFLVGAAAMLRGRRSESRLETGEGEAAIFAAQFVLLGVAGLLFWRSSVWSPVWWLFHALRFVAYVVALASGIEVYRRIEATQRGHLERELAFQMADLDALRRELVEERGRHARPAAGERT